MILITIPRRDLNEAVFGRNFDVSQPLARQSQVAKIARLGDSGVIEPVGDICWKAEIAVARAQLLVHGVQVVVVEIGVHKAEEPVPVAAESGRRLCEEDQRMGHRALHVNLVISFSTSKCASGDEWLHAALCHSISGYWATHAERTSITMMGGAVILASSKAHIVFLRNEMHNV